MNETMTREQLHENLENLGWKRVNRKHGRVDFYLTSGPCDRMIATIPEIETDALCETRGGGRAQTSLAEALAWAQECMSR